ncbi:hypothetical protein K474DRAFT_1607508 [Panus rudis PR-1116 ss-1]|nr:hypothetical protein K474DRAFT_1607508 [Panus rudis PR-1116 ss-1]
MQTGQQLRQLFAIILEHGEPTQPECLWFEFREHLCDDLNRRSEITHLRNPTQEDIYDFGLFLLERILFRHGKSLANYPSMPHPQKDWELAHDNPYIVEQLQYNPDLEAQYAEQKIRQLNSNQKYAFDKIYSSTENREGKLFFLHGPGGTGKTFVYKTLCHAVRAKGWIALCVASSGIAALLLPGGRTAHSTFQIPVDHLSHDSWCNIDKRSDHAEMLSLVHVIIWDEITMQSR